MLCIYGKKLFLVLGNRNTPDTEVVIFSGSGDRSSLGAVVEFVFEYIVDGFFILGEKRLLYLFGAAFIQDFPAFIIS